jgi:hypothetical protein
MLSSISPLGERARRARWGLTVSAYLVGSAAGGLAVGLLSAALGSVLPQPWRTSDLAAVVVVLLVLVGLGLDVRARGGALPSWHRQVDDAWLARYRGWVYGLGFGVQLGAGVLTIVTSSTVYALLAVAAWSGTPWVGAVVGTTFGVARALPVLGLRRVHAPQDLRAVFGRVERLGRPVDLASRASLVLAAAAVAGTVWS